LDKNSIIKNYKLNKRQVGLLNDYIQKLKISNQKHNLVGPSTIDVVWDRHINDSLQLSEFISKKNSSIIDLGTGAGLPGIVLYICGFTNILLIDSKMKKINFIKEFSHEANIRVKTICARVEKIKNQKFDFVVCRALAPLIELLDYSLFLKKKIHHCFFLRGEVLIKKLMMQKKNLLLNITSFQAKVREGGSW